MRGIDGLADTALRPASDDASFRRYFRVNSAQRSFIAMDAPPEREDCRTFIKVAGYLEAMQLNAPRVLEVNLDDGFLLLTDLGDAQYLDKLQDDASCAAGLYHDAMTALALLQRRGAVYQSNLPPYDVELLSFELSLFWDWLCKHHLQIEFDESDKENWQQLCDLLVNSALDQPQVFVHRDYHSRNLMVVNQDNPGILDFQDAVEGPLTYDLVSLLEDSYIQWPRQQITEWAQSFYKMLDVSIRQRVDNDQFLRYFELMGVQRHLKVAGIFARLNHRDGKPGYMSDIPRTLSYIIEVGPRYEELRFVVDLINERCLPALQGDS
ncbi:MAG: phosphotransferase [Gammaproteobacteria bacterium]|nr:phosphotransferase [Gammaproteobacteria bacterium]